MVENLNSQWILFFKFLQKIICILNYKIIYYFFVLLQLISNVLNKWKSTFKSNTTTEFFIPKTAMIPMILENSVAYNIFVCIKTTLIVKPIRVSFHSKSENRVFGQRRSNKNLFCSRASVWIAEIDSVTYETRKAILL